MEVDDWEFYCLILTEMENYNWACSENVRRWAFFRDMTQSFHFELDFRG